MSAPKIVAMSLYGDGVAYYKGAVANALLLPEVFPGWTLRIYCCVHDVDPEELRDLGCEIEPMPRTQQHSGMFWRFLAAWDSKASHVLFRDSDSRFNVKEAAAVREWEKSGKIAHCMKDHPHHARMPMMGGMWGILPRNLPRDLYEETLGLSRTRQPRVADMWFLRDRIHPLIENSILRHSSVDTPWPHKPFPKHPKYDGFCGQQYDAKGDPVWPDMKK